MTYIIEKKTRLLLLRLLLSVKREIHVVIAEALYPLY
jgi:hypothetical protein